MADIIFRLFIGFSISLGLGTLLTPIFLETIRRNIYKVHNEAYKTRPPSGIPPYVTGNLERFFFTLVVAFNVGGSAVEMVSWI